MRNAILSYGSAELKTLRQRLDGLLFANTYIYSLNLRMSRIRTIANSSRIIKYIYIIIILIQRSYIYDNPSGEKNYASI